jgi:hypothetical protein
MKIEFTNNPNAEPAKPVAEVAPQAAPKVVDAELVEPCSSDPVESTAGGTVYPDAQAALAALAQERANNVKQSLASALAVAPKNTALAMAPAGLVLGDHLPDFGEVILPRINIVQGIGELNKSFPMGAVVFGQATVLFVPPLVNQKTGNLERAGTPAAVITVLGFRPTRFVEKVVGGGRGAIVNTEAEVRAQGGTLDYKEWQLKQAAGMKRFEPLAEAVVVVEKPENVKDDETVFIYDVAGKKYALGLWAMKGTSYTSAAKRVFFTARAIGALRKGGYPTWSYNLTTRLETYGANACWIPICTPNLHSTPEFLAFAASILNAPEAPAE